MLNEGLAWEVGDGRCIRFWLDNWIAETLLIELCLSAISPAEFRTTLAEFCAGGVSLDRIPQLRSLPPAILGKLAMVHSSPIDMENDKLRWTLAANGQFSSQSSYNCLPSPVPVDQNKLMLLWKFQGPLRFSMFLW